jgi:5-methylcytosine-specific restriction enzyme A
MRKEFPARVKFDALKRCSDERGIPHCEGCGVELTAGNLAYDHDTPDGLGGEPTLENCKVLCIKVCHNAKTFGSDNPRMQKADRSRKTLFRVKNRKGPAMPGTKASGIRKRMNGEVERRR